ncbi:MAG: dienelactone hydrolase family protein [Actinomycetota bacterium]|nr:dienelactone hydrolase family protein [Actinomycetota bacterium]
MVAEGGAAEIAVDGPKDANVCVVLGPGAGPDMSSDFMVHVSSGLARAGFSVARFNFPYQQQKKRSPDRQEVLEAAFRSAVDGLNRRGKRKLVVGGKSLGGRIASHVVAGGLAADGLLFLGYPLHPPGKPDRLRTQHFRQIHVPTLFVEGTRDPFCPLPTLSKVRGEIPAPTEVAVIDGGDHSFKIPKSSGRSTAEAWDEVVAVCADWLKELDN